MNIADIAFTIAEALATVNKDAVIGEIKDTEERIYEIVDNAIIDIDEIKDIFLGNNEKVFALAGYPQVTPAYTLSCNKLPFNEAKNNNPNISQQAINISQYNTTFNNCTIYYGCSPTEPEKRFNIWRWFIEQVKWLVDKVCCIFNL